MVNYSKAIGAERERIFEEWLNDKGIYFIKTSQEYDTFSQRFKEKGFKRPDYLLFFPQIGTIFVDVKERKIYKENYFIINIEEIKKYFEFIIRFCIPVWFCVGSREKAEQWWWIPAHVVKKLTENEENTIKMQKDKCCKVPLSKCAEINSSDSAAILIDRIFEKSF